MKGDTGYAHIHAYIGIYITDQISELQKAITRNTITFLSAHRKVVFMFI